MVGQQLEGKHGPIVSFCVEDARQRLVSDLEEQFRDNDTEAQPCSRTL